MRIDHTCPCLLAPNGDHVPAPMLSPAEAVEMWRRGAVPSEDAGWLTTEARRAVALAFVGVGSVHASGEALRDLARDAFGVSP